MVLLNAPFKSHLVRPTLSLKGTHEFDPSGLI